MGLVRILNTVKQHLTGPTAQKLNWLTDCGQRDGAQIGNKAVIVADQRKIMRDADAAFCRGALNADRNQIAECKNGSDILLEQFQSAAIACFDLIKSFIDQ